MPNFPFTSRRSYVTFDLQAFCTASVASGRARRAQDIPKHPKTSDNYAFSQDTQAYVPILLWQRFVRVDHTYILLRPVMMGPCKPKPAMLPASLCC